MLNPQRGHSTYWAAIQFWTPWSWLYHLGYQVLQQQNEQVCSGPICDVKIEVRTAEKVGGRMKCRNWMNSWWASTKTVINEIHASQSNMLYLLLYIMPQQALVVRVPNHTGILMIFQHNYKKAATLTQQRKASHNPKATLRWTTMQEKEWSDSVDKCRNCEAIWIGTRWTRNK